MCRSRRARCLLSSRSSYREFWEELQRFGREPDRPDHDGPVVAPRSPEARERDLEDGRRDVEADG